MKRISMRELQKSSRKIFDNAPVEVTCHGQTIGFLTTTAKMEKFSSPSTNLEMCPLHNVYKRTCGCE